MPRLTRLHVPGACYYVVQRGNHSQDIFFRPADRRLLTGFVADALAHTGARIHAYCWLNDRIELLIQVGATPLGKFMQRIGTRYARAVQKQAATTGHLFASRYAALLIDADRYFLELLRHIHLSPVRAGIVAAAEQYRWSGHHAYLGKAHPWICSDQGLARFHPDRNTARALYHQFIAEGTNAAQELKPFAAHPKDSRVLGDNDFLASLPVRIARPPPAKTLEQITMEVCLRFAITHRELRSERQSRLLSRARGVIAAHALDLKAATLSEISRYLNRSPSALTRAAARHGE